MARAVSELKKYRDEHPDVWIPVEVNDCLQGKVVDVDTAWSDLKNNGDGDFYPLLTVETTDGLELKWHAFETVADNAVMKVEPVPGEHIIITYKGESENAKKGQSPAKLFTVRCPDRPPEQAAHNAYSRLKNRLGRDQTRLPVDPPLEDDVPFD